jgi:sugar lactone lactonase YvrE
LYDPNGLYTKMIIPYMMWPSLSVPHRVEHFDDDGYKVDYVGVGTTGATEGPMWSDDHQCFYYVDLTKKTNTLWRLRIGEEPEPMTLVGQDSLIMCFLVDTTESNIFYAGFKAVGLAKLIIEPDSADVQVELLGCDPSKDASIGGGEHSQMEDINDGKVSPDGKLFFCNMQQGAEHIPDANKIRWTMDGNNQISPLLYRYDVEENKAIPQEEVGHFCLGNGPTWSLDGSKFYFSDTPSKELREFEYDIDTSTVKKPSRVVLNAKDVGSIFTGHDTFDGQTTDSEGNIWSAVPASNWVVVTNPETGEIVKRVWLRYRFPLSLCFGGPDYKHLLVCNLCMDMVGSGASPNGGVALVTFEDDSIQGNPTMKMVI